jgi:tubulin polyglutamylase TTLL1/tubulin monoglycylase TTLL3/8
MLATSMNGVIKGYWYEEGYIRTSSEEFSLNDCSSPFIHLTNDAVQKNSEGYGKVGE